MSPRVPPVPVPPRPAPPLPPTTAPAAAPTAAAAPPCEYRFDASGSEQMEPDEPEYDEHGLPAHPDWCLLAQIGKGAFGVVYEARANAHDAPVGAGHVAIKLLGLDRTSDVLSMLCLCLCWGGIGRK